MCSFVTHEGGHVMYVAVHWLVLTDAMASCLIHVKNTSHFGTQVSYLLFAVLWARVKMSHVWPCFMRSSMTPLCFMRSPMKPLCCL